MRKVQSLFDLAELLEIRNLATERVSRLTGRPPLRHHLALYLASAIFDVELEPPSSRKGFSGRFATGPLAGRTVIVQWRAVHDGSLLISADYAPDTYLVFAGPKPEAGGPRPSSRPLVIEEVYVLDGRLLVQSQLARSRSLGRRACLPAGVWDAGRVFPPGRWSPLSLSDLQLAVLERFRLRLNEET